MQLYNSFAVLVSGTSLSIGYKVSKIKTNKTIRLIRNKFPHKKINLDYFLGHGANTTFYIYYT